MLTPGDPQYWDSHPLIRALAKSRAKLICVVHEPDAWGKKDAAFLSPFENIRFVTLSAHVARTLNTTLDRLDITHREVEHIAPIYTPTAHLLDRTKRDVRRAGIVGRVRGQKDYDRLGSALVTAMRSTSARRLGEGGMLMADDPQTWGYELIGNTLRPVAGAEPFELHVIGEAGATIEWPAELDGIVKQYAPRGTEFYRRIHEMVRRSSAFLILVSLSSRVPLLTAGCRSPTPRRRVPIYTSCNLHSYSYHGKGTLLSYAVAGEANSRPRCSPHLPLSRHTLTLPLLACFQHRQTIHCPSSLPSRHSGALHRRQARPRHGTSTSPHWRSRTKLCGGGCWRDPCPCISHRKLI